MSSAIITASGSSVRWPSGYSGGDGGMWPISTSATVLDLEAVGGGDRDDVLPAVLAEDLAAQGGDGEQLLGEGLAVHRVGLRHDRDDRLVADGGELGGDELVARADLLVGREAEADRVDLGEGVGDEFVEPLPQQGARAVQARGVDQDQLRVVPVHDAADGVARGLRLGRGDRDLLADQGVGEGRLARIGPPDQHRETGAVAAVGCFAVGLILLAHVRLPVGLVRPRREGLQGQFLLLVRRPQ